MRQRAREGPSKGVGRGRPPDGTFEEGDLPPQGLGYDILLNDSLFLGAVWAIVPKCKKGSLHGITEPPESGRQMRGQEAGNKRWWY
jgi:hypothetical protein